MIELQINSLFKNALRPLDPDEYERLSKSIESEGCQRPVDVWQGQIIDGHNRYQICRETGQSFKVNNRDDDFGDEADVLIWILDNVLVGRNLDFTDKKKYIGELYNLTKQRDEDRAERLQDKTVLQGDTSENIGSKFGVSGRTVRRYGSEAERQKVLKQLQDDIRKEAAREGKSEDEDWMQERLAERSQGLQSDENESFDTGPSDDDYNQAEPTQEQRAERKASQPKRGPKSKKVEQMQRDALKVYESALGKIQGSGVDVLCSGILLPDYSRLFASIEAQRAKLPVKKDRFGR